MSHTPDTAGRRTAMTAVAVTAAQPQVTYTYDNADKLLSVSQNGSTTTKCYGSNSCNGGDPAGRLHSVTLPNGIVVTYGYDEDSHVTSITYGSLGSLTYGYDADGHRNSVGGGFAATTMPAATTLSYNADNSLKTSGPYNAINDADGNLTCINTVCPWYSYDERGHLQQAISTTFTYDFSYDAFGRRTEVSNPYTSTCYVHDLLNSVATTFDCTSYFGVNDYLGGLGLDELFMVGSGSTAESFLRDALNSTVAMTNSSGSIVDQSTYDPYGNTTDSNPSYATPFEFTGRENDATGLYYMRARYYSPQL